MNYETMKAKAGDIEAAIYKKIDDEAQALKDEYTTALENNFQEEDDGYDDFDSYLEGEADNYLDFAFGAWLDKLLENLIGAGKADLEALSSEDHEKLTQPYFDYFKAKTGLGIESEDL